MASIGGDSQRLSLSACIGSSDPSVAALDLGDGAAAVAQEAPWSQKVALRVAFSVHIAKIGHPSSVKRAGTVATVGSSTIDLTGAEHPISTSFASPSARDGPARSSSWQPTSRRS